MPENNQPLNQQTVSEKANGKSRRGFASMDRDRHKLVSSQGGRSPREKENKTHQIYNRDRGETF
jgi:hypothetical protein